MTQPEALRLAELLDLDPMPMGWCYEAAAELRRLSAENERLHQINQSHEMKLSVRGYEIQIADLEAQRDALLEALKWLDKWMSDKTIPECVWKVRATIKRAEGEGA